MSDAMWYCYYQLMMQKSPRKILLVVSDGCPVNKTAVIQAYEWARSAGIETLGLGIKNESIKSLFDIAESIDDISELEGALFTMTGDVLTSAA